MDKFPPFSEFEIPYDSATAAIIVATAAIVLVACGATARRAHPRAARALIGSGAAAIAIWAAWEGIVRTLGLDSVLGYFLLTGFAVVLGAGAGYWSLAAPDGDAASDNAPPEADS